MAIAQRKILQVRLSEEGEDHHYFFVYLVVSCFSFFLLLEQSNWLTLGNGLCSN